jgi:transcriptional regulator with XRE-family HTH domain
MSLADGRELVEDLKKSGLSQRAFAESLGISVTTVQYWQRRVRQSSEFVAVHVVEEPEAETVVADAWFFEVELEGGHVVRVRSGFAEDELRQVLRAAAESC